MQLLFLGALVLALRGTEIQGSDLTNFNVGTGTATLVASAVFLLGHSREGVAVWLERVFEDRPMKRHQCLVQPVFHLIPWLAALSAYLACRSNTARRPGTLALRSPWRLLDDCRIAPFRQEAGDGIPARESH